MQSNITLKKFVGSFRKTLVALGLVAFLAITAQAQTYVNGNLGTGTLARNGVTTAPAGTQWHELQNDNGNTNVANASLAFAYTGTFTVADNFVVPAGQTWTITNMTFYGIQPTAAPITAVNVRIYNGKPGAGGTVVYGDLTTNVLASTAPANIYGAFNSVLGTAPTTAYPITTINTNVSKVLTAGTYWVEWKITAGSATFAPTSQVVGTRSQPAYNAIQSNSGTWTDLADGGTPASTPTVPVDLPFKITYTSTGGTACTGTPAPGATITSAATVCPGVYFNLSLTTPTTGDGVTYQWQSSSTQTGTYTNIIGATSPTLAYVQSAATWYRAQVTCGANTGTSTPVNVAASTGCYCVPAGSDCTDGDLITNVKIDALNNNSTCGGSGYTNYTINPAITIPNVVIGGSNPISVTAGDGSFTENVAVWIDYNQNGTFEASEFTLIGANAATPTVRTGSIAVPATALPGNTRMRVRVRFSTLQTGANACTTYAFGETEDYTVKLVPCTPIAFTTQPASVTAACGVPVTLTAAVTGSLPVYQWEYKTSAASTNWINVTNGPVYSGATTATLSISAATSNLNGYQYRLVVSGACSALDFSNTATLTVNPLVGAVNPASASICLGSTQQLSITTAQPATTLTFNSAANLNITIPDDGSTVGVSNVIPVSGIPSGVTITSIKIKTNLTHSWAGDMIIVAKAPNNKILNLAYALNATGGTSGTTAFTPTFSSTTAGVFLNTGTNPYNATFSADGYNPTTGDPTVPTGPNGFIPTSTAATRNTFADLYTSTANANTLNGNWTLAMYDYFDDFTTTNRFNNWSIEITYTGGLATGVWTSPAPNSLYLDAAATVPYAGTSVNTVYAKPTTAGVTTYTVIVDNGVCTSAPVSVPVTTSTGATSLSTVANQTTCVGNTVTFSVVPTGGSLLSYQWQVSTDGGASYTNIAGATSASYTTSAVTSAMNNNRYRAVVSSTACGVSLTSNAATLTVNPLPVIVLSANPYTSLLPGLTTTLTAAVSPNAGATYTWYRNNVVVAGALTNTLAGIGIDALGDYTVKVTDINGCTSTTSTALTIKDSASGVLFIYPTPNNGKFHVRFYNERNSNFTNTPRILNVFDNKGSRIFSKRYNITGAYTDMNVDISNYPKGIYTVDLLDIHGNRLKTGRVTVL